jgi:hypothetical protein
MSTKKDFRNQGSFYLIPEDEINALPQFTP